MVQLCLDYGIGVVVAGEGFCFVGKGIFVDVDAVVVDFEAQSESCLHYYVVCLVAY